MHETGHQQLHHRKPPSMKGFMVDWPGWEQAAGQELPAPFRAAPIPATLPTSPIGLQAQEIIASILEDPAPGLAEVKYRLRKYVAACPGFPEKALLAHLMETWEQANAEPEEGPAY